MVRKDGNRQKQVEDESMGMMTGTGEHLGKG